MPQLPRSSESFNGFGTLSQLVSSPAVNANCDFLGHEHANSGLKALSLPSPKISAWIPQHMSTGDSSLWEITQYPPEIRDLITPYDNSPASTSPSPRHDNYIGVQQEQNHKRRAQNRAAQRAYRDRKMRHLVDLEGGIREIEDTIRRLQAENTGLIRELCEVRAENREWKEDRPQGNGGAQCPGRTNHPPHTAPAARTASLSKNSMNNAKRPVEADSLYEPFAAMWNLIRLDPSVVQGNVSAATVLERLRGMAEKDSMANESSSMLNSMSESDEIFRCSETPKGGG